MTEAAREWAKRLGTVGVWTFEAERMPAAAEREYARAVESLGFKTLWIPESLGSKEAFAHASLLLAATKTMVSSNRLKVNRFAQFISLQRFRSPERCSLC